jgi:integrase
VTLPAGIVPGKSRKSDDARFSLGEVATLIGDERIPIERRVMYAIKALTGARHGEVIGAKWTAIDWTAQPREHVRG